MRRSRRALARLAGALVLAAAAQASAHPHVWISVACAFALDADGRLATVRQSWTFDEMYSSYAVFGLDADGDGHYSPQELAALRDEMASSYREDNFFSKASLAGADVALGAAEDVDLRVGPNGALVFSFVQRLATPASVTGASFRLQVRDPSVFIDFQFPKTGFGEPPRAGCSVERDDGQPPKNADPEALMRGLIDGTAAVPARAVTLICR